MKSWQRNPATAFFEMALDNCKDLVFVKNDRSEIVYANRALREIYHPDLRDRLLGETMLDKFAPEEVYRGLEKDREALETGFSHSIAIIRDYRGRRLVLSSNKTRFVDQDGNIRILGVATDVSEAFDQMDRNRALEKFALMAAHDLVSPLGTAVLMLECLRARGELADRREVSESIDEVIGLLRGSSNSISSVLIVEKALRDHALDRCTVAVGDVVANVLRKLKAPLAASSAHVDVSDLPNLDCNPTLLDTLFQNLIENAIKYRSDRDPVIAVSHRRERGRDVFAVTDNGKGMSADVRDRVFRSFEQGDNRDAGFGVGLGLCKSIVDAHGGLMWIDESHGDGTRIKFTLSGQSPANGLHASQGAGQSTDLMRLSA